MLRRLPRPAGELTAQQVRAILVDRGIAVQPNATIMLSDEEAMALASEARDLGRSAGFLPSVVSAGIDLMLMFARRHDPGRAEALLPETAAAAVGATGTHRWLWESRLTQARAELALARGALDTAVAEASKSISQSRTTGRPKYEALALITRAHALHRIGRTHEAIVDARHSIGVARGTADPVVLLLTLDALLTLDGNDESAGEARALQVRISSALPTDTIRQRFTQSDLAQRVHRI